MGLVDYNSDSDSGSGSEADPAPAPAAAPAAPKSTTKKPFQKLASSSGKILVSLPTASSAAADTPSDDGPPAKRAKLGTGGGRFSNFSSFLPPPTKTAKPSAAASLGGAKPAPRPGVHLKTSSEAAFSRSIGGGEDGGASGGGGGLGLPTPKAPSVPDGQKAAEDVKLVGKATMFRPLSVARKPVKKKAAKVPARIGGDAGASASPSASPAPAAAPAVVAEEPVQKKAKISLFGSIGTDEMEDPAAELPDQEDEPSLDDPTFSDVTGPYNPTAIYSEPIQQPTAPSAQPPGSSLSSIADDLNLSAAARRELFGRGGKAGGGGKVVNFSMDREYAANEALRASGEAVQHNPVRAIQPGKHSLKQIINTVQNQESALEENFAKNRATQREAGESVWLEVIYLVKYWASGHGLQRGRERDVGVQNVSWHYISPWPWLSG